MKSCPLWVWVTVWAAFAVAACASSAIALMYTAGQKQISTMADQDSELVTDSVSQALDAEIRSVQLAAHQVSLSNNQSKPLIQLMNILQSLDFASIGFITHGPPPINDNEKYSWQLATGYGCPEYNFCYMDESNYPSFECYCAFSNFTVLNVANYNGTDQGLKPLESAILAGNTSQGFLPIFALEGYFTITYELGIYDESPVIAFAEEKLTQLDSFMATLQVGKTGLAYVVELSGLLVTATVPGQTQTGSGWNIKRVAAIDANDTLISQSATTIGNFNLTGHFLTRKDGLIINAQPYTNQGLQLVIVTVVPESDYMGDLNHVWGVAIGVSIAIDVIFMILSFVLIKLIFTKPLEKLGTGYRPLGFAVSEIHDLEEKMAQK